MSDQNMLRCQFCMGTTVSGASRCFAGDEVAGEFAEGEAVADGERHVVDVGFAAGVEDGALDGEAADRVGAVEDDDVELVVELGLLARGGFEEVAEDGFVGPEVDAGVLEVDDDGVEVFELVVRGAAVGVCGP